MQKKFKKFFTTLITFSLFFVVSSNSFAINTTNPNKILFPTKIDDNFFRAQFLKTNKQHGTLLETQDAVSIAYPTGKTKKIAFVSTDTYDRKIRATATLIIPPNFNEKSGIMVYNQFVDSMGAKCSIGYSHSKLDKIDRFKNFFAVSSEMISEVYTSATQKNMAILMPDADGPLSAFAATYLEGHIILDAMRAVKQVKEFDLKNRKMGVFGYSGGGLMTAWAAVLQPKYAPELSGNITEFLAGGTPVNFEALAEDYSFFNGTPSDNFGYAVAMAGGLSREYASEYNLVSKLSENGLDFFKAIKDECLMNIIFKSRGMSGKDIFKSTSKPFLASLLSVVKKISLINYEESVPSKPFHFWHAASDTIIPQNSFVKQIVKKWKTQGVDVDYQEFAGDHVDYGPKIAITGPALIAKNLNS